jgi:hypothetical protein
MHEPSDPIAAAPLSAEHGSASKPANDRRQGVVRRGRQHDRRDHRTQARFYAMNAALAGRGLGVPGTGSKAFCAVDAAED